MKQLAVIIAVVMVASMLVIAGCDSKPKAPSMNMQDGQWEMTMKMDMPGMPPAAMQPRTITTCLSKKDLIPQSQPDAQNKCEIKNRNIAGDTVTWEMVCPNMTGKGTMTYAGTTVVGGSETTINMDGKIQTIKTAMSGKYLGPCPEKK
jgi:hypothetical protein